MQLGLSKEQQLGKVKKKKKATNRSDNPYFKYMRTYRPECIICQDLGEIHHIDLGYSRNDDRIVMLCLNHHSAQSNVGIHHDENGWYKRFYSFEQLEEMAEENLRSYSESILR